VAGRDTPLLSDAATKGSLLCECWRSRQNVIAFVERQRVFLAASQRRKYRAVAWLFLWRRRLRVCREVLRAQGDLSESARLHRESLAMKRRLHGDDTDHPGVAVSHHNLAEVLRDQGDLSESARCFKSLAMERRFRR
jgi:hypothetical protein